MTFWESRPSADTTVSPKHLVLLVVIAFVFSMAVRMLWTDQFAGNAEFMWNGQFMINTNDGYCWAEGARDILSGTHQANDLSPIDSAPALLTALAAKLLPFSFETVIFYMPAVLGSLIVIPMILIGRLMGHTYAGFIAALIASIAHSYYNRTMIGYYDTDMLNIVLPLFIVWGLLFALIEQRNRYLLITAATVIFYGWWYSSSYTLNAAIGGTLLLYTLLFERTNRFNYKLIAFYLIGISQIPVLAKILISITLFTLFHFEKNRIKYVEFIVLAGTVILFFATGGINPIIGIFGTYAIRGANPAIENGAVLHFYNVMDTVREAGHIDFQVLAERLSGHVIAFAAGLVGYLLLLLRYRLAILTLPLFGLGMFAIWGGLRFTVYAVPFFALGSGYLIVLLTHTLASKTLKITAGSLLAALALIPNIAHVIDYKVPTVLTRQEVQSLDRLKSIAGRNDYVVTWWDYGYPIRYYSDVKTWIDGGKHSGDVNYPASYVLTSNDPMATANMMRLYTEYTEKRFTETNKTAQSDFEYMMTKEGFNDPDTFLASLSLPDKALPKKTADVYLYLPLRMMEIFPTVSLFSTINLKTGETPQPQFFFTAQGIQDTGDVVELGSGVSIVKSKNIVRLGGQEVPIKSFYQVGYDQSQKLQISEQLFSSQGLTIIFLPSYGKLLVVDDYYLHSTYIQMFVFERYDPALFEPVGLDPMTKIYRLKR